jgi:hypothetical protein
VIASGHVSGRAMGSPRRDALLRWAIGLGVIGVTVLAFLPSLGNGFVAWDDRRNLTDNPHFRGLGPVQLRWMLTTTLLGHYMPLTWLTFGVDYVVWGMRPVGYHLTSLLLHAGAAALCYAVALRLLRHAGLSRAGCLAGAAIGALFFAVHPLRVESVAWATERRDVLSGLLFLATVRLHLAALDASGGRRHRLRVGAVTAFAGAIAAKAIVITLPLVLLLLDVYPLRRLPADPRAWRRPGGRAVVREKAPFLVLASIGAATGYYAHLALPPPLPVTWESRLANGAYSLWFYAWKTAVPGNLGPLYEVPVRVDFGVPVFAACAVATVASGALLVAVARRVPGVVTVWLYHALTLAPVSGLVPLGGAPLVADRYSYLPGLGWGVLVGSAAGLLVDGRPASARPVLRRLGVGVLGLWLAVLGGLTSRQTLQWRDTETLWRHAVAAQPACGLCHFYLGDALLARGAAGEAVPHLSRAAALLPRRLEVRRKLGDALARLGRLRESMEQYRILLHLRPHDTGARANLAIALDRTGRAAEARALLVEGLQRAPGAWQLEETRGWSRGRP